MRAGSGMDGAGGRAGGSTLGLPPRPRHMAQTMEDFPEPFGPITKLSREFG